MSSTVLIAAAETERYFPRRPSASVPRVVQFSNRQDDVYLDGWSAKPDQPPAVLPSRGVKVWRPEFTILSDDPIPPLFAVLVQSGGKVFTWVNIVNNKLLTMVPGQEGKDTRSVLFDFVKAGGQKGARGFKAIKRADMCCLVVLEPIVQSDDFHVHYASNYFHVAATLPKGSSISSHSSASLDGNDRLRSSKRVKMEPAVGDYSSPCSPMSNEADMDQGSPGPSIMEEPSAGGHNVLHASHQHLLRALEGLARAYNLNNMRHLHNAADLDDLIGSARNAARTWSGVPGKPSSYSSRPNGSGQYAHGNNFSGSSMSSTTSHVSYPPSFGTAGSSSGSDNEDRESKSGLPGMMTNPFSQSPVMETDGSLPFLNNNNAHATLNLGGVSSPWQQSEGAFGSVLGHDAFMYNNPNQEEDNKEDLEETNAPPAYDNKDAWRRKSFPNVPRTRGSNQKTMPKRERQAEEVKIHSEKSNALGHVVRVLLPEEMSSHKDLPVDQQELALNYYRKGKWATCLILMVIFYFSFNFVHHAAMRFYVESHTSACNLAGSKNQEVMGSMGSTSQMASEFLGLPQVNGDSTISVSSPSAVTQVLFASCSEKLIDLPNSPAVQSFTVLGHSLRMTTTEDTNTGKFRVVLEEPTNPIKATEILESDLRKARLTACAGLLRGYYER